MLIAERSPDRIVFLLQDAGILLHEESPRDVCALAIAEL